MCILNPRAIGASCFTATGIRQFYDSFSMRQAVSDNAKTNAPCPTIHMMFNSLSNMNACFSDDNDNTKSKHAAVTFSFYRDKIKNG